jgi:hypothetical protein
MTSPATMNLNTGGNRVGRWSHVKMSALRQKPTFALHWAMSALPPKADTCSALAHVRFGPIADILSNIGYPLFIDLSYPFGDLKLLCTDFLGLDRRERLDNFICCHNGIGVVREIDFESGVHLLV